MDKDEGTKSARLQYLERRVRNQRAMKKQLALKELERIEELKDLLAERIEALRKALED